MTPRDPHGLLQAILDDPADDLPRLAYADWLDETGTDPAWAFHIRRMVRNPDEGRLVCAGLVVRVGLGAEPELILKCPFSVGRVVWRRGFIAEAETTLDCWLQRGPGLVRSQPVERVCLRDRSPAVDEDGAGWYCYPEWGGRKPAGAAVIESDLPAEVWSLLDLPVLGESTQSRLRFKWKVTDKAEVAVDALSKALVLWAKRQSQEGGAR